MKVRASLSLLLFAALPAQEEAAVIVVGPCARWQLDPATTATVLAAISAAAPREDAVLDRVVLLRVAGSDTVAVAIDVAAMVRRGDTKDNVQIAGGDVLFVPSRRGDGEPWTGVQAVQAARALLPAEVTLRAAVLRALRADSVVSAREACLAAAGTRCAEVVPALLACLQRPPALAREAAQALGMLGGQAAVAVPHLERLLQHDDRGLREAARAALRRIRVEAPPR